MLKKYASLGYFSIIMLFLIVGASADTLDVPGTYANIQAAINAASNGDLILIDTGTYTGTGNTDIDPGGKAITIQGAHRDSTVCGRFIIDSGEDTTTIIRKLRIGGTSPSNAGGGAMYISSSSPKIEACRIGGYSENQGGGIYMSQSSAIIRDCIFWVCEAHQGGGVYASQSTFEMKDCNFWMCKAWADTGGYRYYAGQGGAIYLTMDTSYISRCSFENNFASGTVDNQPGLGGAIYLYNHSKTVIDTSVFDQNASYYSGPNEGRGGAIYCTYYSSPELNNLSLGHNDGGAGRALYVRHDSGSDSCAPVLNNCLIWESNPILRTNFEFYGVTSYTTFNCCNFDSSTWLTNGISNWLDSTGNMSEDPLYCYESSNYSLDPTSPCLPDNNNCDALIGGVGETGDILLDESVDLLDILYLIAYIYDGGPFPVNRYSGSVTCDATVNLLDILCLQNHIYYNSCDLWIAYNYDPQKSRKRKLPAFYKNI